MNLSSVSHSRLNEALPQRLNQISPRLTDDGLLRRLREERNLSEQELARNMGVSRGSLRHLERRPWKSLRLGDLELLAQGLGMRFEQMLQYGRSAALNRCSIGTPLSVTQYGEGIAIRKLIQNTDRCFVGVLKVGPKKIFSGEQIPYSQLVYWLVLKGGLQVSIYSKDYFFKEGECFWLEGLQGQAGYELYNPHQIQDSEAMLLTLPASLSGTHGSKLA